MILESGVLWIFCLVVSIIKRIFADEKSMYILNKE